MIMHASLARSASGPIAKRGRNVAFTSCRAPWRSHWPTGRGFPCDSPQALGFHGDAGVLSIASPPNHTIPAKAPAVTSSDGAAGPADFKPVHMGLLRGLMTPQHLKAGEVLIHEGQRITDLFLIKTGSLSSSVEGDVRAQGILSAGSPLFLTEFIQWVEQSVKQPDLSLPVASRTIQAATDVTVLKVDAEAFKSLATEYDVEFRVALSHLLAQQLEQEQETNKAMSERIRALGPYVVPPPKHGVLGTSRQANKLRDQIKDAYRDPTRRPVLLVGEPGTGTGDIAALIHYTSCNTGLPLVKINCQRLGGADAVELFGCGSKPGLLGLLQGMPPGCSLLLEDAHLLPEGLLPRVCELLRSNSWLATTRSDPTASHIDCGLDPNDSHCTMQTLDAGAVRIILTSDHEMPELSKHIKWHIKVPPLRARPSDIPSLVAFYLTHEVPLPPKLLEKQATAGGSNGISAASKPQLHLSTSTIKRMQAYGWPGNEEELSLVVMRAARQHLASQSVAANTSGVAALAFSMEVPDRLCVWGDAGASSPRLDLLDVVPYLREMVRSRVWPDGINFNFTAYAFPVLIALLILGPQDREHNAFLNFFWCWWWPLIFVGYPLAGRVWCSICPFMIYGELAQKWREAQGVVMKKWPRKELEAWGPVFMFSLFTAILAWEEVWDLPNNGTLSAYLLLLITAGAVVCSSFFERRMWCRYLCPIGGMNGLMAKGGCVELRAREGVCAGNCSTYHCIKGGGAVGAEGLPTAGCPMNGHPAQLKDNCVCAMCMSCVRACPNRSVQILLRPPLADIWDGHGASWGELAILGLLGGAMYLHSLSFGGHGPLAVQLGLPPEMVQGVSSEHILLSLGIMAAPSVAVGAADFLGRLWARHIAHVDEPAPLLTLGYSYLPFMWAGTLAFYIDWFLSEGGRVVQAAGAMVGWPGAAALPALAAAPPVVDFVQGCVLVTGWVASLMLVRRLSGTPTWLSVAPHALLVTLLTAEMWYLNV